MVSPSSVQWKRVVCQANMGSSTLRAVQTALRNEGLYNGPIDGINGTLTKQAVKAYQKAHGLSVGGLTHEVMKALGVSF
jgi:peptidoglycan hydrolase-like protein with peptidoglycan-binding domain